MAVNYDSYDINNNGIMEWPEIVQAHQLYKVDDLKAANLYYVFEGLAEQDKELGQMASVWQAGEYDYYNDLDRTVPYDEKNLLRYFEKQGVDPQTFTAEFINRWEKGSGAERAQLQSEINRTIMGEVNREVGFSSPADERATLLGGAEIGGIGGDSPFEGADAVDLGTFFSGDQRYGRAETILSQRDVDWTDQLSGVGDGLSLHRTLKDQMTFGNVYVDDTTGQETYMQDNSLSTILGL